MLRKSMLSDDCEILENTSPRSNHPRRQIWRQSGILSPGKRPRLTLQNLGLVQYLEADIEIHRGLDTSAHQLVDHAQLMTGG